MQSAAIVGGTLADANGGVIQVIDRGSSLNGVTLPSGSEFGVPNNDYLTLVGSLTNNGTVALTSGGNDTRLLSSGSVTLTGTGVVQLSNNSQNFVYTSGTAATLINAGNTIEGAGQIGDSGLSLNNEAGGTVDATAPTQLIIFGNSDINAGLLEDTGPSDLLLTTTTISNSGTIAAPNKGSTVNLQSAAIAGGTLADANGGVIQVIDRGSSLDNVTLSSASDFHVTNNNYLTIAGALDNLGTLYEDRSAMTRG